MGRKPLLPTRIAGCPKVRFSRLLCPFRTAVIGAVADWQLAASAVVTGNRILTQEICTFKQGRIADRSHEAEQFRASGLNPVIAAIVYWNSTYIADAVAHLRSIGEDVPDELLARTSPVAWRDPITMIGPIAAATAPATASLATTYLSGGKPILSAATK
ncbi:MAG: hypothetical protein NVS3B5_03450 [Sphingomicrobium sp.]